MKLLLGIIKQAQLLHWAWVEILSTEMDYDMRHVGKKALPR